MFPYHAGASISHRLVFHNLPLTSLRPTGRIGGWQLLVSNLNHQQPEHRAALGLAYPCSQSRLQVGAAFSPAVTPFVPAANDSGDQVGLTKFDFSGLLGLDPDDVGPVIAVKGPVCRVAEAIRSYSGKINYMRIQYCVAGVCGMVLVGLLQSGMAQRLEAAAITREFNLNTDPHLVGWWPFEATSGKVAPDSSAQNHDAIMEGEDSVASHSVPGRIGRALRLEGTTGLQVPNFHGITGTQPRTIAVWIKTQSNRGQIVAWGTDEHGQMWIFGFIRGRIGVTPKGGYLYMNAATNDDHWHHLAVVVQEAAPPNLHDHVTLYLDGEPAVIHDIGLLDLWPIETGREQPVYIGRGYQGLLDDLRIYDRALTDREIKALFSP